MSFLWETLIGLPTWLLIAAVRFYQITLSPLVGRQCRFSPTCSNYMIQAVQKHGLLVGVVKGTWRVLRCNPFCRGGYVPP